MPSTSKKYLWCLLITIFIISVKSDYTNFTEKIQKVVTGYGYPFEIHHVETDDGYILEIHRIPHGEGNSDQKNKPVALLKHGLVDSSASFMFAGPNASLAYILADNGYDVWMSNSRGNYFSRQHKQYSSKTPSFWQFSWHDIGLHDTPAVIDYILEKTNQEKIFHVCFSEGCTELYVLTSLNPEYNDKIKVSANLAPLVFFGNPTRNAEILFYAPYQIKEIFSLFGYGRVLDHSPLGTITNAFCQPAKVTNYICVIINYLIMGFDWFEMDFARFSEFLQFYPAGASIKEFIHYGALVQFSGTFRQFDYGRTNNRALYNSQLPPRYPLGNVTLPVAIFHGVNDLITSLQDVITLAETLPNVVERTSFENFNHIDVYLHRNVKELLYDKIIELFRVQSNNN